MERQKKEYRCIRITLLVVFIPFFAFSFPCDTIPYKALTFAQSKQNEPLSSGILLPVHPGDKINAEVYAKYASFNSSDHDAITGMAGYLANTFGAPVSVIDGVNIFSGVDQTPAGVFSALANADDDLPLAFLTYVVYDRDMVPVKFDYDQVSTAAAITEANPTAPHERLALTDVAIEQEGFIYIYVSNQSDQNMDVYFDDLKVTHYYSDIVAGSDYYPFGLEINDRRITREKHRFGYQGLYAEKDEETGWNHFELREYDPVVGRWTSTDPAGQYYSPYVGIGNNPASGVDPDGAYTWLGALIRSGFGLWGDIYQSGWDGNREVWGFNTSDGVSHFGSDARSWVNDDISNRIQQLSFQQYMYTLSPGERMLMGPGDAIQFDAFSQFTMVFSLPARYLTAAAQPSWMVASAEFRIGAEVAYAAKGADAIISKSLRIQKQVDEHIIGGARLGTNSYLNSVDDATSVLNAVHSGEAKILSTNIGQNRVYVQYNNVTGYYNNNGVAIPTNKFLIKGGKSSTVVPIHPNSATFK